LLRQIGPARDWDVFLGELLPPLVAARDGELDLAVLIEAAEAIRKESYAQLRETIGSERYTAFLTRFGAWLEAQEDANRQAAEKSGPDPAGAPAQPLRRFAEKTLQKRHKKVLKLGRGFKKLPPEARHDLRIGLKKLRYSAEFFRSIYPNKQVKPYLSTLKELLESLGYLNDVAQSHRLMKQVQAHDEKGDATEALNFAAGVVVGWHAHANLNNEKSIRVRWVNFVAAAPFWEHPPKGAKRRSPS
jgi:triphosphatase